MVTLCLGSAIAVQHRKEQDRGFTVDTGSPANLSVVIPEIDIWRVANLMLTRYGEEAMLEGAQRAHELAADGDRAGAATWLRITAVIGQLANTTSPETVH
jgi:hypothetical protein